MTSQDKVIAKRNVWVSYGSNIPGSLIFLIPVWVAYELQYISLGQLPIIEAVIQGTQTILELPTGALADLWGKRMTVVVGYAISTLASTVYVFSRSFESFLAYAIILGIGQAFVSGAREALIYDSLKAAGREDEFAKVAAKASLIFQIGLAVATLAGGLLGSISLILPIGLSAVMALLNMVVFTFALEPRIDTEKFTLKNYVRQTRMGFREIFKSKYVRDVSIFYILVGGITWAAMMIFNATLLTQLGYSASQFGWTVAAIRIINGIVLFGALSKSRWFDGQTTFVFIAMVMLASYLPGWWLTKSWAALAVAGSIFASTFRWVVLGKVVNRVYESRNRATAISTLSMAVAIMVVLLAVASGPIMERWGIKIMFTGLGLLTLGGILPLGIRIAKRYQG